MTMTDVPRKKPRVRLIEDQLPAPQPRQPWDRLPTETARSYSRFLLYRDMTTTRSVRKVADSLGMSEGVVAALAQQHRWTRRVEAYIEHLAKAVENAKLDRIRRLEEDEFNYGRSLMRTGRKALELKRKRPKAAGLIDMSGSEIAKMGETGSVLRRRSMGLPIADKGTAVQVNVQANIVAGWLSKVDESGPPPEDV